MRIGNPVVVLLLICAFLYIYFVYLRGSTPLSLISPPAKTEKDWDDVPPKDPNIVALAGPTAQPQTPIVQPQIPVNPPNRQNLVQQPNQPKTPQGNSDIGLPGQPNQPNQNFPLQPIAVPDKTLQEGHWIGMEVIPLTAAIAEANGIPPEITGVLIDEVTLLSAEAGLYAGDVITAINGKKVKDLKSFRLATREVAQSNRANLSVYSGGKYKTIVIFSSEALGIAQMEAAPMILATDRSPHGRYGPCDRCHAISRTPLNPNQLLKDQGDSLTKVAPNIRQGTPPPHRNRGTCTLCHVVL
jgi:hypothetical protein